MADYQKMRLKVSQGITLTKEQVEEVASLMNPPDMGWSGSLENPLPFVYEIVHGGEHGLYNYRVNRSWGMLTLLQVN